MLITTLDIVGTFAFAITGCFKAIKHELDILGLVILGLMTGIGGGIMRDCILGVQPQPWVPIMYFFICLLAAGASYFTAKHIAARWNIILLVDAIGLGVFTAVGCTKAATLWVRFFRGCVPGGAERHRRGIIRDVPGLRGVRGSEVRVLCLCQHTGRAGVFFYFSAAAVSRVSDVADVCHDYCNSGCQAAGAEDEFWLEEAS